MPGTRAIFSTILTPSLSVQSQSRNHSLKDTPHMSCANMLPRRPPGGNQLIETISRTCAAYPTCVPLSLSRQRWHIRVQHSVGHGPGGTCGNVAHCRHDHANRTGVQRPARSKLLDLPIGTRGGAPSLRLPARTPRRRGRDWRGRGRSRWPPTTGAGRMRRPRVRRGRCIVRQKRERPTLMVQYGT